jgi:hypothetical protein
VIRIKLSPIFPVLVAIAIGASVLAGSAAPASAAQTTHTCKPVDVTTFPERIHVRCNTAASGGIVFFAIPTANSEHAARILSTLLGAHLAGRTIVVGYDSADVSGTAFGCAPHDCRRLLYVGVQ